MTSPVDPEKILSDAVDLIVDGREAEAEEMLNAFIAALKGAMNGADADAQRHYWWGKALTLQDEWEQALLRFERALEIDPDHKDALWETATILMDALDKPESAKTILQERLLKLDPGNADYAEALASAETLIRRRDGKPLKEWRDGVGEEGDEPLETGDGAGAR